MASNETPLDRNEFQIAYIFGIVVRAAEHWRLTVLFLVRNPAVSQSFRI